LNEDGEAIIATREFLWIIYRTTKRNRLLEDIHDLVVKKK
jgi:hypothetical protein